MLKSKINKIYTKHDCVRICQGDLLKDVSFITNASIIKENYYELDSFTFQYMVVLSQDCDLEYSEKTSIDQNTNQTLFNQYQPNLLLVPAFLMEDFKSGIHLKKAFDITQKVHNGKEIDKIKNNTNEIRFHYLPYYKGKYKNKIFSVQEMVIDFKIYFTLPINTIFNEYMEKYVATINELYREALSVRFANYISRIGLPNQITNKNNLQS
ncbi:MAG TPA: hypothetical protein HA367_06270 [Candidatus Methanofastidiosum sp.]|nr:hypothetical protein [Methanofastidiosum sp.]